MVPAVGRKQERETRTPGGERGCTLKEDDQGKSYLGRPEGGNGLSWKLSEKQSGRAHCRKAQSRGQPGMLGETTGNSKGKVVSEAGGKPGEWVSCQSKK